MSEVNLSPQARLTQALFGFMVARTTVAAMSLLLVLVLAPRPLVEFATRAAERVSGVPQATGQAAAVNPLRTAYFGDLHVHTSWSLDSYIMGGNRDGPSVAYRYGRGDPISRPDGTVVKLRIPLDFMAVTDHDGTLGEVQLCEDPNDPAYHTVTCGDIRTQQVFNSHYNQYHKRGRRPPEVCEENGAGPQNKCYERSRHLWREIQQNADEFYQPGRFTTFPGFEWTASPPGFGHHHRNVIFEGQAVPEWGGSAVEMQNRPERLWAWLRSACTGDCRVVAIPHNSNLSGGIAFTESGWAPHTPELLRLRAWAEPLVEIHQIKGSSECYQGLGTTDEECAFENYIPACEPGHLEGVPEHYARCAHASDYVRNALKNGLRLEAEYGVNPFKFGVIGSTDDHQSLPGGTDENDFTERPMKFGTGGRWTRARTSGDRDGGGNPGNPGGLVGVWAEQNTRASIFDALRRKETFGTSGSRIRVRFFGGWHYPADQHEQRSLVEDGYRSGVPMGSDLPLPPRTIAAPRFVAWAAKDAGGANLQKIQIVKGWAEASGETHEQVFDVACADGGVPDRANQRCPDAETRMDLETCGVTHDIGSAELSTTWTDSGFNRTQRAFYYARVLEIPTCRWTAHRALVSQVPIPDPPVVKERAWSSPIWYTPSVGRTR